MANGEADKFIIATLGSEKINSSISFARVFKMAWVVFSIISLLEKDF